MASLYSYALIPVLEEHLNINVYDWFQHNAYK